MLPLLSTTVLWEHWPSEEDNRETCSVDLSHELVARLFYKLSTRSLFFIFWFALEVITRVRPACFKMSNFLIAKIIRMYLVISYLIWQSFPMLENSLNSSIAPCNLKGVLQFQTIQSAFTD